jgi:hypothetical protein
MRHGAERLCDGTAHTPRWGDISSQVGIRLLDLEELAVEDIVCVVVDDRSVEDVIPVVVLSYLLEELLISLGYVHSSSMGNRHANGSL